MIAIDGSLGEGGGQIIRTALALSLVTGRPFHVENFRARRAQPGLRRQHVTAVNAAAQIGNARVCGAGIGARWFSFKPGRVVPGDYTFAIGTAGSTSLVLQTVLPPLLLADAPSRLTLEGGTHNDHAPPFEFLAQTFLPLINRMGPRVSLRLERYGFYPPGGGRIHVAIEPAPLRRLDLSADDPLRSRRARALVVKLPPAIAARELAVVREVLGFHDGECEIVESSNAVSPGNVVIIALERGQLTELVTGIGRRGVRAEQVARETASEAGRYLAANAPVGEHLADQLLVPLAVAGGGSFVTGPLSPHTTTNMKVVRKFLDVTFAAEPAGSDRVAVTVRPRGEPGT